MAQDERKAFAARLNEALDEIQFPMKGYGRQQSLADRMHVSQKGARKWLEGEAMPEQFRVVDLARWLDVNFEWLATGHGAKRSSGRDEVTASQDARLEPARTENHHDSDGAASRRPVDGPTVRDGALAEIRSLIDGQHRAFCITDDDAILLHAALKAVRGRMEPSIRAAILLMLGSQGREA